MKRGAHAGFLIIATLLLIFLGIFPFLTFDAIGKLLSRMAALEPGNFLLVLYLELSRAFTTIVALFAAVSLVLKSKRGADARALALFLIFIALTYEKIFGTTGYPGPLQEKLAEALLGAGIRQDTLIWLFGPVPWSLWLALAALLRFSVVFPNPPLSPAAIDESGKHDRRGMLRGAGIAGLDIGAAFRGVSKRGLTIGAFRPVPLWTVAIILVVLTTITSATTRIVAFAIAAAIVTSLAITNLRASYNVVADTEKARMRWLVLGFSIGAAIFMIASLPLLFFDDPMASVPALVLLMVAPAVVMVCLAVAVLYDGPVDAGQVLYRLPGMAALGLTLMLVFALATTALSPVTARMGMSRSLALLGALAITALLAEPLRRATDRSVTRILERPVRSS